MSIIIPSLTKCVQLLFPIILNISIIIITNKIMIIIFQINLIDFNYSSSQG